MRVASFFAGCGGLDLGFRQAGFEVVWANEIDPAIHATYMLNHPGTELCKQDIRDISLTDIPDSRFVYSNIRDGYKMVGNAVPPRLAKALACSIIAAFEAKDSQRGDTVLVGFYKDEAHLAAILRNKLYYVRTGFRKGSMQYPSGKKSPDYLVLHNSKKLHLFSLKGHPTL